MGQERTNAMVSAAILNFLFGGMGILSCLHGLMTLNRHMADNAWLTLAVMGTGIGILLVTQALILLPPAAAAIVSAIGILKPAPWARAWILTYAILSIFGTCLGFLLGGMLNDVQIKINLVSILSAITPQAQHANPAPIFIIGFIYPVILVLLTNTKWKDAFRKPAAAG